MISLELESFAYDDGAVLADIAFSLGAGERALVVGASGSGKSTLARVLAGQLDAGQGHRFVGTLSVAGEQLVFAGSGSDPRIDPAAWAQHVGYVGQRAHAHLSMVCASVAEEIAFGLANRGVPAERMHVLVDLAAARLGLTDLLERDPRRISGGELQRVAIAAAVVGNPAVLVLDEPFKGLDVAGRRDLESLLAALGESGTAILLFEPMLPRDAGPATRVLVLSGGSMVPVDQDVPGSDDLGRYGVGVEGVAANSAPLAHAVGEDRIPAIRIRDLSFGYGAEPVLSVADLAVSSGEAVAVLGPNGSGKSTLLQHLNGLLRPEAGRVQLYGEDLRGRPVGSLASTVGHLFQDTDQQLFEHTVLREVAYGPRAAGRSRKEAERCALQALAAVGLADAVHHHPHDLSFRDRRLVALASLMATGPRLWVLDEPTVGLDLRGREVLSGLLRRHIRDGGILMMATHDEVFAQAVCSRMFRLGAAAAAG
ncbi:energy-coupling factor transport system ATP-binding protein [Arthrobacter subterraneus]|uniref:Energy-coupling factor transport system ATP-binding protein n=1 Tax=Arthrobacter subterraneus TaxID=335973 RepID=A0A1G8H5W8_9MICC|nr:ABC transporter ATP-binding protein [Arthrobacter subterraneus]SDI02042.1 energy-coupling factor transport system ATP-binding protein [Arthrobacter subterraneus]